MDYNFAKFKEHLVEKIEDIEDMNLTASDEVLDALDVLKQKVLFANTIDETNGVKNDINLLVTKFKLST